MQYDAVFYEAFDEEERKLRSLMPSDKKCLYTWKAIQESGDEFPPAPVISTRTQSKIPASWAPMLKGIITRSTGYDHISEYLRETGSGVKAAYLPDYAARAVAEEALAMWASLLRLMDRQKASFKKFHRDGLTGREIKGRRILVIGVGRIGSQIVDIAHGLGMRVRGVDLAPRAELAGKCGLEYVGLDEGVRGSEIIVCALPLTDATRGMLDYDRLKGAASGAIFINIARGEISPAVDLLRLLREGRLAGVGLDVYDHEKELAHVLRENGSSERFSAEARASVEAVLELAKFDNVILTPHNAFNTEESVERKSLRTVENFLNFCETGEFLTSI